jgi:hypothetical protein
VYLILRSQGLVGKPLAVCRLQGLVESLAIPIFAGVEPESLLVQVPLQVLRSPGDVSTAERPLKDRPEALDIVHVRPVAADVFLGVIYDRMDVIFVQVRVMLSIVSKKTRAMLNRFVNLRQHCFLTSVRQNPTAHSTLLSCRLFRVLGYREWASYGRAGQALAPNNPEPMTIRAQNLRYF